MRGVFIEHIVAVSIAGNAIEIAGDYCAIFSESSRRVALQAQTIAMYVNIGQQCKVRVQ